MQAPNTPGGLFGYSVRNYAPPTMYAQYPASQCASSTKSPPGKSFTIDALLAKTEDTSSCRSSLTQCADRYYPAAPFAPLAAHTGLPVTAAPYLCSPGVLHAAGHMPSGYSLYCCPPFSYQPSCRGAFYAQASMSKVNTAAHSFKSKGGKSKRIRTSFTSEQLSRLEKEFARQQYMVGSERFLLASALQLTEAQVRNQNRQVYPSGNPLQLPNTLFPVLRSKSGSRTDASSGANRVWSSSKPNWPKPAGGPAQKSR
ncbi:unnamed protein product, partial [Tetraodon nigroviridis]